jgi:1,6-anhydro-N-acetylmuramate kinase
MKQQQPKQAAPTVSKEEVAAALKKLPKEEVIKRLKTAGYDPKNYGL